MRHILQLAAIGAVWTAAVACVAWGAEPIAFVPDSPKFTAKGAQVGEQLPNLTLRSLDNEPVLLDENHSGLTVYLTSSFTCPKSRAQYPAMAALAEKYKDKFHFVVLYVIEAYPAGDPSPYRNGKEDITDENKRDTILKRQPTTIEKRLELAAAFKSRLNVKIPIVVDGMNNLAWMSLAAGRTWWLWRKIAACWPGRDGSTPPRWM